MISRFNTHIKYRKNEFSPLLLYITNWVLQRSGTRADHRIRDLRSEFFITGIDSRSSDFRSTTKVQWDEEVSDQLILVVEYQIKVPIHLLPLVAAPCGCGGTIPPRRPTTGARHDRHTAHDSNLF
jgi:hypothetical protein